MNRPRPALAGLALLCAVGSASAQNVMVYLFDRLEQPAYARSWAAMLGDQRHLPYWLVNKAKGSTQGAGKQVVIEGRDAEVYGACQPHNCSDSRFMVMFTDRGTQAKGVLVEDNGTPRFFGRPNAAEATMLLRPGP